MLPQYNKQIHFCQFGEQYYVDDDAMMMTMWTMTMKMKIVNGIVDIIADNK